MSPVRSSLLILAVPAFILILAALRSEAVDLFFFGVLAYPIAPLLHQWHCYYVDATWMLTPRGVWITAAFWSPVTYFAGWLFRRLRKKGSSPRNV